jgi:hypothetical protein
MAFATASTFLSLSLYQRDATPEFLKYLALLLILIGWNSIAESAMGNLVFRMIYLNSSGSKKVPRLSFFSLSTKALLWSAVVAIFITIHPAVGENELFSIGAMMVFVILLRLMEATVRIINLTRGSGLRAQLIVNFCGGMKWLTAGILYYCLSVNFLIILSCHVVFSIASIALQLRGNHIQLGVGTEDRTEQSLVKSRKDELVIFLGIALGVLGFQLDKITASISTTPSSYASYIIIANIIFFVTYFLGPIFSAIQQSRLARVIEEPSTLNNDSLLIRCAAFTAINVVVLLLVAAEKLKVGIVITPHQTDLVVLGVAVYFNCLAHNSYIRYQVTGQLTEIVKQNALSVAIAIFGVFGVLGSNNDQFSIIVLCAAVAQYSYGIKYEVIGGAHMTRVVSLTIITALVFALNCFIVFSTLSVSIKFILMIIFWACGIMYNIVMLNASLKTLHNHAKYLFVERNR